MIDFSLSDEERAVRDTIRQFIQQEVMPLEDQVLRNERSGLPPLEPGQLTELQRKAKAGGWWGINTPEQYGGIALGPVMSAIVAMETGRTFVPFRFGGSADNILYAGHRRAEAAVPHPHHQRRAPQLLRDHRAGRGLGRPQHQDPGGQGRRRLGHQRREDVHHRRQRGRLRHGLRGHRPRQGRRRRGDLLPGRPRHGLEVRADPDDGRVGARRAGVRGRPGPRAEHPRRARARASRSPCSGSATGAT